MNTTTHLWRTFFSPLKATAVFVLKHCWAGCSGFSQFPQQWTGANESMLELRDDEMPH